jgi:hypothetical protein
VEPRQSIDFDALLVFTRTLGAFRRGFRYCPAKGVKYQIRNDLHVQRHVYWVDEKDRPRRRLRPLRDIPHLYVGTVDGFRGSTALDCEKTEKQEVSVDRWGLPGRMDKVDVAFS